MESRDDEESLQKSRENFEQPNIPETDNLEPLTIKSDDDLSGQLCCTVGCLAFFNLILGLLFYQFSTSEDYYGGEACINLREVSYGFAIMNIIGAALLFMLLAMIPQITGTNIQKTLDCFGQAYLIFFVAQVIYSISLFTTLFQNEECELLRGLAFMYFWMCVLLLSGLCCCCCGIFLVGATSRQQPQPQAH